MENKNNQENLYIFFHMPKCAGSTFAENIKKNLESNEYLQIYIGENGFKNFDEIGVFLNNLSSAQKNKIKIIYGHHLSCNIHNLFPGRTPKYFTFLREPTERIISHYNYCVGENSNGNLNATPSVIDKNGKTLDIFEWIDENDFIDDYMCRILIQNFARIDKVKKVTGQDINFLKEMLQDFYFIGTVKNFDNDAQFLYDEMGFKKFFTKTNVSKKVVALKNDEYIKQKLDNINNADREIYNLVLAMKNQKMPS